MKEQCHSCGRQEFDPRLRGDDNKPIAARRLRGVFVGTLTKCPDDTRGNEIERTALSGRELPVRLSLDFDQFSRSFPGLAQPRGGMTVIPSSVLCTNV